MQLKYECKIIPLLNFMMESDKDDKGTGRPANGRRPVPNTKDKGIYPQRVRINYRNKLSDTFL